MGWSTFWNGRTTIYVNEQHRRVHYENIAADIVALLPSRQARILDYGCGEALSANRVADRCGSLVLCDAAQVVRAGLEQRFAEHQNITIASPSAVEAMPAASFDVIVANSVVQYLKQSQLTLLLAQWRRQLAPSGVLIVGDLIPHDVGPITDVTALLRFAHGNGFLTAAFVGLIKTYFSDYRHTRAQLGLLRFSESEFTNLLHEFGFEPGRQPKNIGHNPARMTITAAPSPNGPVTAPSTDTRIYFEVATERAKLHGGGEIAFLGTSRTV